MMASRKSDVISIRMMSESEETSQSSSSQTVRPSTPFPRLVACRKICFLHEHDHKFASLDQND